MFVCVYNYSTYKELFQLEHIVHAFMLYLLQPTSGHGQYMVHAYNTVLFIIKCCVSFLLFVLILSCSLCSIGKRVISG